MNLLFGRHAVHVSVVLFVLSLAACTDESTPPDPCAGISEVKARFTVKEVVSTYKFETDTFVSNQSVEFAAAERYDSYEWHIGSDARIWTDSAFRLGFPAREVTLGAPLPITLIAKRAPNISCTPTDDGVDTLTKHIVIILDYDSPILGEYKGVHTDSPLDTFNVRIYFRNPDYLVMQNINRGCQDTVGRFSSYIRKELGATVMTFDGGGVYDTTGCKNPKGVLFLDNYTDVRIEYEYDLDRKKAVYVGKKIK